MGPKVKQTTLWNHSWNWKLVWSSKTGLESRGYHYSQAHPCVFYIKYSVILTYVDDCVIVSQKQETIKALIESLNGCLENYALKNERDI